MGIERHHTAKKRTEQHIIDEQGQMIFRDSIPKEWVGYDGDAHEIRGYDGDAHEIMRC